MKIIYFATEDSDKLGTGFLDHFVRKPWYQAILCVLSNYVHSFCAKALRYSLFLLILLLLSTAVKSAFADDDGEASISSAQVLSIQTLLVDTDGRPIAGVKARINGLRCAEEAGNWYSCRSVNVDNEQESESKADGAIEFRYPTKFGLSAKCLTTTTLDIDFRHPDYVTHRAQIRLVDIPKKIELESGCRLQLSAIDRSGKPVERLFPIVPLVDGGPNWTFSSGSAKTGGMPQGKQLCVLVCPSELGTLFSQLFEFETVPDKMVSIPNILVQHGKRIFGRLPDTVPRPIEDGRVSIDILMTPDAPLAGRKPVQWRDWVAIAEDGTFEFQSVPGPAQIQVIAICRGWIIRSAKEGRGVYGQMFDLAKDHAELEVAFEMEQTGDIRLELMDVDGKSVVGAKVSAWIGQIIPSGWRELELLSRSIDFMERQFKGDTNWSAWVDEHSTNRHNQVSDSEGMVTLRDIPVGSQELIHVEHSIYELPSEIEENQNVIKFKVHAGKTEERLLVLHKRETQKLKEEK